jgi:hypothetical protein
MGAVIESALAVASASQPTASMWRSGPRPWSLHQPVVHVFLLKLTISTPRPAPEMYKTFRDEKDGCIKVVLKP